MAKKYTCKSVDHICSIAFSKKFRNWKTIWDDKANKALKRKRGNPNLLFKGDKIILPQSDKKKESKKTDKLHSFEVSNLTPSLNLRILNIDFTPLKKAKYELTIKGVDEPKRGKTDDKGEIKIEKMPPSTKEAVLVVTVPPQKIKDEGAQGGDEVLRSKVEVKGDVPLTWKLKIGGLNPIREKAPDKKCVSGVQQRLNNLGIDSGPVDGKMGPNTKAAIETFQCLFKLTKDGDPAQEATQEELEKVHDKNTYNGPPDGEVTDISPVPSKKRKKTTEKDIGFVAPHLKDAGKFELYNNLVIRPIYRISLKLGDIERLFPWPIDTQAGRLARLQVLGLFYWPLNHRVAAGKKAKPPGARYNDNQAAYTTAWEYFKDKFCGGGNDAAAEKELKKRLKEWIVQRYDKTEAASSYNSGGETTGGGLLPVPAEEDNDGNPKGVDEQKKHFAKIRLPGGWSFFDAGNKGSANMEKGYTGTDMYDSVYNFERRCYALNQVLGKIPLVAIVEKYWPKEKKWKPAKGVQVYFQLQKPYDLPAFDNNRKAHQQLNRPPLIGSVYSVTHPAEPNYDAGQGPKYYMEEVWDKYSFDPDSDDPQVNNCHKDCGGKRGNSIAGTNGNSNILRTGRYPGFAKEHGKPPKALINEKNIVKRALDPAPNFNEVKKVTSKKHPHSVRCRTNEQGEAGVLFMPSRCSGDRYRIRAYVGPDTLSGTGSDGKGDGAVKVDTGSFVIWRNMRMSRFIQQEIANANQFKDKMVKDYFDIPAATNAKRNELARGNGLADSSDVWQGLPYLDLDTVSGGKVGDDEDGIRVAFAKAFCEFELDPGLTTEVQDGKTTVKAEKLEDAEWKAAVECGIEDLKVFVNDPDINDFDLDTLLYRLSGAPIDDSDIDVTNGFIFPTRTRKAYIAADGAGKDILQHPPTANNIVVSYLKWLGGLFTGYLYPGFMRHVAKNGYLPGVTIVQGAALSSLEGVQPQTGYGITSLFGIGTHYAGAFVMKGRADYARKIGSLPAVGYGYTACVIHEIGHVIFKVHAPGWPHAAGFKTNRHDSFGDIADYGTVVVDGEALKKQIPKHGTCDMSYRDCEGFFCSRCLLQLRGWNILSGKVKSNTTNPLSFTAIPTANTRHEKVYVQKGRVVRFDVSPAGGSGSYAYQWKFGDGNEGNVKRPTHRYENAGPYSASVTVTDNGDSGKTATGSVPVTVTEPITFTAGPAGNPSPTVVNQDVTFSVTPSGGSGEYTYKWEYIREGKQWNDASPQYRFTTTGEKRVKVTVKDKNDAANRKHGYATVTVA